jgi:molybdate transport system substrate-binding protein
MTFKWMLMMKKANLCITAFLLVILLAGCGVDSQPPALQPVTEQENGQEEITPQTLTVSAAASLTDVMEEIKGFYEEKTVHTLVMNYGSSGALQQQIEQGAPADVFISAAQRQMDVLQEEGLILAESRVDLLENKVVLIIPVSGDNKEITDFNSLTTDSLKLLAIGEPESVPAGRYAKEVLSSLGIWKKLEEKCVLGKDVRQVLTYVETGNVDAGIVYMTDALTSEKVKIAATAPAGSHTPVTYPAAIVLGTSVLQVAEDFMAYLQSNEVAEIFERHGFTFIAGR